MLVGQLAAIFDELNNDDILVMQDEAYVLAKWDEIHGVCTERSDTITRFEGSLEALEQYRAERVGTRLASLVETLVEIAFDLPPAIERMAEQEA